MKRIFIGLFIAALSITGVYAQDADLRAHQQKQEQELQAAIRTQTQQYVQEAEKRMQTRKSEVKSDLEARRSQLTRRPDGMVPYKGN